ncbi:MAG: NrtA/SsuA/CpmA family ABC transporter substrate-binding protein [Candidatus Magnetominusculus sp. LBB02]|nr:NrtA/SsuA/CpmA family ABC transporter substrate-binding protein [Candidatus Magnetominusculus sp. LBB02]
MSFLLRLIGVISLMLSSALNIAAEGGAYYSNYKFAKSDNQLNIGVQPLYLPSGVVTTIMSRDLILRKRLKEMGMTITFFSFLAGRDINQFFLSDDLQAGVVGDMPAISAAAKKDVIIPAIVQQSFTAIIARRPGLIEGLRGQRVGYVPGSTAHYTLLRTLSHEGMTEKDVQLVPLDTTKMAALLHEKKIFAISAWEPTVSLTLLNYPETTVISRSLTFGYIYFSKEFYIKHPEAVREVLAAEIRAIKWIKSDRANLILAASWTQSNIKAIGGYDFNVTPEQIADIAAKDMTWQNEVPVIPEKILNKDGKIASIVEFLRAQGKIDSNVSDEKVIGSFDRKLIYDIVNMSNKYRMDEINYE